MFCPNCGSEVNSGAAFCGNCGAKLGAQVPVAYNGIGTGAVNAVAPGGAATPAKATNVPKKKKKTPLIIAIAIIVIALVAAGIGFVSCGGFGVSVKDSTEAYTWDELSKISAEIAKASDENAAVEVAKKYHLTTTDGKLDGTQTKSVTLSNGTQTAVQIIGFAHDEKTSGGKAGITFIFKDCIGERSMNSSDTNEGGWEKSQMRSYLNSEGLSLLPEDLRQKIIAVDKLTNNAGATDSVSSVSVTSDQLWLLSYVELTEPRNYLESVLDILNSEGTEYKLYEDMGVTSDNSNNIFVKNFRSQPCRWWGRSPYPGISDTFGDVNSNGYPCIGYGYGADLTGGVCPGFCI